VNSLTDQQLLRDYTGRRSEAAFAELVRRHVDFVYSAALRMVRDAHLAEDVTQSVFLALAQNARQLTDHAVLSGWLHRVTQNLAANAVRSDVRRRAREQEAAAMNELLCTEPDAVWEHIAPQLDEALGELNEGDRDALLLRYFERKSAREMAQTLGTSEDAAQKRVTRAVERLREFFAKRGITVGASGLVVVITANAVQAAPVGLAATIATAAALAGTAITTTATATKAIVMTTLQKTLIAATVVAAVGTGIYEARQASKLREQNQTLQKLQAPLADQIQQLTKDRDEATRQLVALRDENERLNRNTGELLKLRGEVTRLRNTSQELALRVAAATVGATNAIDAIESEAKALVAKAHLLKQMFEQMPDRKIPELRYLGDQGLLQAAKSADLETDAGISQAMSDRRQEAKELCVTLLSAGLEGYTRANAGQLPTDISQLKPYCFDVDDVTLQRYQIIKTGNVANLPLGDAVITEKSAVDEHYDTLFQFGIRTWSWQGIGENKMHGSGGSNRAAP
jgi:RNA polymerase sigma factor (sigma-70 family)